MQDIRIRCWFFILFHHFHLVFPKFVKEFEWIQKTKKSISWFYKERRTKRKNKHICHIQYYDNLQCKSKLHSGCCNPYETNWNILSFQRNTERWNMSFISIEKWTNENESTDKYTNDKHEKNKAKRNFIPCVSSSTRMYFFELWTKLHEIIWFLCDWSVESIHMAWIWCIGAFMHYFLTHMCPTSIRVLPISNHKYIALLTAAVNRTECVSFSCKFSMKSEPRAEVIFH